MFAKKMRAPAADADRGLTPNRLSQDAQAVSAVREDVQPRTIAIVIAPLGAGRFVVTLRNDGVTAHNAFPLVSRQPLLDAARVLVDAGCDPETIVEMRHANANHFSLRAPLNVAAALTVNETKTVFAEWKPFPQSAVQPRTRARSGGRP